MIFANNSRVGRDPHKTDSVAHIREFVKGTDDVGSGAAGRPSRVQGKQCGPGVTEELNVTRPE